METFSTIQIKDLSLVSLEEIALELEKISPKQSISESNFELKLELELEPISDFISDNSKPKKHRANDTAPETFYYSETETNIHTSHQDQSQKADSSSIARYKRKIKAPRSKAWYERSKRRKESYLEIADKAIDKTIEPDSKSYEFKTRHQPKPEEIPTSEETSSCRRYTIDELLMV
jgi:hypothetical protein